MWTLTTPAPELILRNVVVYSSFLLALRLFGKREVGQFTLFDLALVLLAANALQPAMTGPDQSLFGAGIIIATLFTSNKVIAFLRVRSARVRRFLEFEPTIIGQDGRWLLRNVERQDLDFVDLEAALREHGLERVEQVKLATLEADGSISIVPITEGQSVDLRRRRRRYRPRK